MFRKVKNSWDFPCTVRCVLSPFLPEVSGTVSRQMDVLNLASLVTQVRLSTASVARPARSWTISREGSPCRLTTAKSWVWTDPDHPSFHPHLRPHQRLMNRIAGLTSLPMLAHSFFAPRLALTAAGPGRHYLKFGGRYIVRRLTSVHYRSRMNIH